MPTYTLADPTTLPGSGVVIVGTEPRGDRVRLAPGGAPVESATGRRLLAALRTLGATGAPDEVLAVPTLGRAPFPLVVATGLGPDPRAAESIRVAVGAALRSGAVAGQSAAHIAIAGPVGAIVEGAALGGYAFTRYKSDPPRPALRRVTVAAPRTAANRSELARAKVVAEAVCRVRDLVNTPPNDLYPESFATGAAQFAQTAGVDVEILDERALRRGRYGLILAVGSGSARPPRLVRLSYRPAGAQIRVALVGKGITFDSGGLDLKTADGMLTMKADMGGAAAVVAAVCAIAALRLPIEVVATVPMAENLPSGSSYRPSDIVVARDGSRVEIGNTDAEGRLILADAIARAAEDDPDYLIEASTLTGAQSVALGTQVIGAMGQPRWRDRVTAAGNAAGESIWAMPLPPDLRPGLDSPVADLRNVSGARAGGMLVGGLFLAEFVPAELPWVHLDIAGPSWNSGAPHGYTSKGGTGAGVRTIIAAVESLVAS